MLWRHSRTRLQLCICRRSRVIRSYSTRNVSSTTKTGLSIASILALPRSESNQQDPCIEVTGHVRTIRNQKRRSFVKLGDGSTTSQLQALLEPAQAAGLSTGTSVTISGVWRASPSGLEQPRELHAEAVKIIGQADPQRYPIQKKYHSAEYLRTIPHLRLRTPFNALLARLRSDCEFHISNFFRNNGFVRVYPPIITSSDCEGAGEVFTVCPKEESLPEKSNNAGSVGGQGGGFFRTPKYLTVSSQLHLEAFVHEHQRVWNLSPTFRAEKSDTPRHLSEFYMLEAEVRSKSLDELMDVVENLVREISTQVWNSQVGHELLSIKDLEADKEDKQHETQSQIVKRRWQGLKKAYWPRITYTEAISLLEEAAKGDNNINFYHQPSWHSSLQLEHENYIADTVGQGSPVFVTDYPKVLKPFYMLPSEVDMPTQDDASTVACFDLLLPDICEVVGGSLREHRLEPLIASMQQHGLGSGMEAAASGEPPNSLDWYLDLRRYGSVPHGGFGLGFDRLISYLSGVDNVKDVVPWPRHFERCEG